MKLAKQDLQQLVLDALKRIGRPASVAEVAAEIWNANEHDLRASGELFYTWQYDMRWAAQKLQERGLISKGIEGRNWGLNPKL